MPVIMNNILSFSIAVLIFVIIILPFVMHFYFKIESGKATLIATFIMAIIVFTNNPISRFLIELFKELFQTIK